jgi:tight adherence protein B
VRERGELRRELHALTAQARLSRYVVTALPLVVAGAVWVLNPSYIRPLFETTTGEILIFVAAGLLIGAWRVMRMITDIEV